MGANQQLAHVQCMHFGLLQRVLWTVAIFTASFACGASGNSGKRSFASSGGDGGKLATTFDIERLKRRRTAAAIEEDRAKLRFTTDASIAFAWIGQSWHGPVAFAGGKLEGKSIPEEDHLRQGLGRGTFGVRVSLLCDYACISRPWSGLLPAHRPKCAKRGKASPKQWRKRAAMAVRNGHALAWSRQADRFIRKATLGVNGAMLEAVCKKKNPPAPLEGATRLRGIWLHPASLRLCVSASCSLHLAVWSMSSAVCWMMA